MAVAWRHRVLALGERGDSYCGRGGLPAGVPCVGPWQATSQSTFLLVPSGNLFFLLTDFTLVSQSDVMLIKSANVGSAADVRACRGVKYHGD